MWPTDFGFDISLSLSSELRGCVFLLVPWSLLLFVMSESDGGFFSDCNGSLFIDDDDLNPEEETVTLDSSGPALLNHSMPFIYFDDRSVSFFPGLSVITSQVGDLPFGTEDSKFCFWLQRHGRNIHTEGQLGRAFGNFHPGRAT